MTETPRRTKLLAEEINLSQIDNLVTMSAEKRLEHEETETGSLIKADFRRQH
jgi:hypothetical protein